MNILNYLQIYRINIFARLICVLPTESDNYNVDEADKYMTGWHYMISQSNMGMPISYNDSDLKIYVHQLRALDYLKAKLEKVMEP